MNSISIHIPIHSCGTMSQHPIKSETFDLAVSELFHENTKYYASDPRVVERIMAVMANPVLQGILATSSKRYPSAPIIELPTELPSSTRSFDEALLSRRSFREFNGQPLTLLEVAKVLFCAAALRLGSTCRASDSSR